MSIIEREISKEQYDSYNAMSMGELIKAIEETLSCDILCGYGYYGCYLSEADGKYFVNIRIGSSCD